MTFTFRIEMVARVTIDADDEEAARKIIDDLPSGELIERADAVDWEVDMAGPNDLTD